MAASVTAKYDLKLNVYETLGLSQDLASDPAFTHAITGLSGVLDATTGVPATKVWSDTRTLSGGTETLDLTALTRSPAATVDMTGLKVQLVLIKADATNTQVLTIAGAAATPYELFGDSSGQTSIPAGGATLIYGKDGLADVSATVKSVTISSTHLTASYSIIIVAG